MSTQLKPDMRGRIEELQAYALKFPQISFPTDHSFTNGMYARRVFIPAGTLFVGRVHKQDHFFMLLCGKTTVTTDDGVEVIEAPYLIVSRAGTKRAGITQEDCVFVTIHKVSSTDLDEVELEISEIDPASPYNFNNEVVRTLTPPQEKLK